MLDRKKTPTLSIYRDAFCEKKKNHFTYTGFEYFGVKLGFWAWFQQNFTLLRLRKDDVLKLPEKTYESIAIEAPPHHWLDHYGMTVEDVEAKLLAGKGETYAEQRRALGMFKATQAVAIIKELQHSRPDEQYIVFCHHREVVTWLSTELKLERIYGDTPMGMRQRIIKAFQQGTFKGLALSVGAAGVGITLTAATRLYWIEKPYLYAEEKQAEDRIHRIGQEKRIQIINLYCPKTLDVPIEKNLRARQGLHDDMYERTGKKDWRW
jgi:superfamily II DNA/RNA helicase